jgi:sugar phosphate permease
VSRKKASLKRLKARVFGLTWLSYASYYLTRKNLSVAKSALKSEEGLSLNQLGLIDTSYLAFYAVGQFLSGALGDRFGPRRVLGYGMLASAATCWVFGAGSIFTVFLVAFGLNGLFQSTGWSNNVKAMAAWFAPSERGRVMGFWCTNYQVGGIVATALAGFLIANHDWRVAFYAPAIMVAVVGGLLLIFLVERPEDCGLVVQDDVTEPIDSEAPDLPSEPEPDTAGTSPFICMIKKPAVWALGGAYFCIKLIRYSLLFWLPYYLQTECGYEPDVAAYASTAFDFGGVFGVIVIGWASDRFMRNRARISALALFGLAIAFVGYPIFSTWSISANVAAMAVCGFLLFGPDALLSGAAAQDIGGADGAASAAGIINGLGSFGALLQGLVTTMVAEAFGWDMLFYVFVFVSLLAVLTLMPLALKKETETAPQTT